MPTEIFQDYTICFVQSYNTVKFYTVRVKQNLVGADKVDMIGSKIMVLKNEVVNKDSIKFIPLFD